MTFLTAMLLALALTVPALAQMLQDPARPAPGAKGMPAGFTPATEMQQNGGIGVQVLFVGRNPDGKQLTVSVQIQNTTDQPLNLAMIGPAPAAIDNRGVTYTLKQYAGLASCKSWQNQYVSTCMRNSSSYLPNETFGRLDAGSSSIVALTFEGSGVPDDGFLSISLNLAVGTGDRVTDANREDVRNIPITFPIVNLAPAS
ncbi:MAG: hypothetical protein AAGD08_01045 [Pseudomonadota bacterium]